LVEMLIVVSIILIITVAVVAVAPRFTDDRKMSRAADQIAQILLTAKQRAKRDQIPTGVRFFPDPQHNNLITQAQYIQQPDDFAPAALPGSTPTPGNSTVALGFVSNTVASTIATNYPQGPGSPPPVWPSPYCPNWPGPTWSGSVLVASSLNPTTGLPTVDFTGGFGDWNLWPVQPGDYLSVQGTTHLIVLVSPSALVLAPVAPFQPPTSVSYPGTGNTLGLANTAQIAPGMIVTAPWGDPNNTTTVKSVNNTSSPQSITLSAAPSGSGDWIGFLPGRLSSKPSAYNVIRAPRVLTGETPLQLPAGICIDPYRKYNSDPFVLTQSDIMFSPDGRVLNARGTDRLVLWARDYTKDVGYPVPDAVLPALNWPPPGQPGDQFLVVIQTHTGFIAEHPVNTAPGNVTPQPGADPYWPYRFAMDARSSGL
jgi:type II secretory pathway pseudopilin PulG